MSKKITNIHNPPFKNEVKIRYHLDSNWAVMRKTPYVNDEIHGLERWWYESGSKAEESMWKDGKEQGLETYWYENGQKRHEEICRSDKQHGVATSWREDGKKESEAYFIRGQEYAKMEWNEEGSVLAALFSPPTLIGRPKPNTNTNPNPKSRKTK